MITPELTNLLQSNYQKEQRGIFGFFAFTHLSYKLFHPDLNCI